MQIPYSMRYRVPPDHVFYSAIGRLRFTRQSRVNFAILPSDLLASNSLQLPCPAFQELRTAISFLLLLCLRNTMTESANL